jgi:TetR/AcrR family transcriptional regulator, regulator of autoinduction and epiphytic fitness
MGELSEGAVDPRVLRTRRIVLEAVVTELADEGYGGFSIESVAARAGVGKSTIYRHWNRKPELIADALETLNVQPQIDGSATASEQVQQLLVHLAAAMADSPVAACVPALIEAAERDPAIGRRYRRYAAQRRQALRDAIAQGITAGEFPAHLDPDLVAQALAGAIVYRRVMTDEPLTPQEVPALTATILGPR